jgi:hypothetical protein
VLSVKTSGAGVITVQTTNLPELKEAANSTITLTPLDNTNTPLTTAAIPVQVASFRCQAGSMPTKYLPGSCK